MLKESVDGNPESATEYPRISIITPSLNAAEYVGAAIESVLAQRYRDAEHIVVDGGSTDATLQILAGYSHLRVVAEPDEGSYDALNKALQLATGNVIGVLNADDLYPEHLFDDVARAFAEDPDLEVVVCRSIVFEENVGATRLLVERSHMADGGFSLAELCFGAPAINSRFFQRRVFERVGGFDNSYRIAGDRDFLIRLRLARPRSRVLARPGVLYRSHAGSATLNPERRLGHQITIEHARLSGVLTRIDCVGSAERQAFAAWHAFECAKLAWWSLRAGEFGKVVHALSADLGPLGFLRLLRALALRRRMQSGERWHRAGDAPLR